MQPTVTLLILWMGHFLIDFMIGIFSVYKTMIGLDLAIAGLVAFMGALIGEGSQALFGSLSDRGRRGPLIALGLLLSCGSIVMAYTQHYAAIFPLILLTYLGSAAFHPSAAGVVGQLSRHRKGLFLTLFTSGGAFGLAASQIAFYSSYQTLGSAVFVLAIPSLLLALGCCICSVDQSIAPSHLQATPPRGGLFGALRLFKIPALRKLYWTQVCNQTLFWAAIFLLPDILHERGCEAWVTYGGGHLAFILGGACMMVPGGLLADYYSPRQVILAAMTCSLVFYYAFLGFPIVSSSAILGILFCMGASLGVVNPVGLSMGHRILPSKPGLVSAFIMGLVWCVAESVGPGSAVLTKLFTNAHPVASAMALLGSLNLIGLVLANTLPRKDELTEIVEFAT